MSKPRNSVLHLFDPLASPSAPLRNAPSPDSDKENSSPTRFSFFGLTHHSSPVKLTRRLVDVGDITVQDHSIHLFLIDDDEPDAFNNDENDSSTLSVTATPRPQLTMNEPSTPSNTSPRTPLAELPLEHDITLVARSKTYRRSPLPTSSLSDPEHVTSPPHGILSVINEVNSSGTSFASPSPTSRFLPLPQDTNDSTLTQEAVLSDFVTPQIIVSSADSLSNSVATLNLNLEFPSGSLLTDTIRPFENTPPSPPPSEDHSQLLPSLRPTVITSSHDANRHSIDLYSSFQLHLQSEEESFDLLNDRVSFFAPGSDAESFFGDDSFDMAIEEANMEKALEIINSQEKTVKPKAPSPGKQPAPAAHPDSPVAGSSDGPLYTPPTADSKKASAYTAPPDSARKYIPKRLSLGSTPSPKMSSLRTESAASPGSPSAIPVFVAPSPRVESRVPCTSVYTPRPSVRGASVNPPPAVPALKIVKRAKRFDHEKSSSSGSASSSVSSLVPEPVRPALAAASIASKGQKFGSISSTTDLQIGKEGSSTIAAPIGSAARIAGQGRAAPAPTVAVIRQTGAGPRRVPITEGQGSAVSTTGVSGTQGAPPAIGMVGPKRVPVVAATKISATVPAQVKAPAASGLKPPARYGGGSASALPRPVVVGTSRLPSSSSSSKMRTVGTSDVNGNAGGKGFGVRRMMFGGK